MDHLRYWDAVRPNLPRFTEAHVARFLTNGRASNLGQLGEAGLSLGLAELLAGAGWLVLTRLLVGDESVAWNYDSSLRKLVLLPANL